MFSRVAEGKRGNQQGHSQRGEDDERGAPPASDRRLPQCQLGGAQKEQEPERPLGMHRLVLHQAEEQKCVQQGRPVGNALLEWRLDTANQVRGAESRPVDDQKGGAGGESRERTVVAVHGPDNRPQPDIVVDVACHDAQNLQLKPAHPYDDRHKSHGKNRAGRKAVDADVADGDGRESQQEGEPRDHLGLVAEGMHHHQRGHGQHEKKIGALRGEHMRGGHMIHRVCGKEDQGPAAPNAGARQDAVPLPHLEEDSGPEQRNAGNVSHHDLARRPESPQLVNQKERYTDHEDDDSELVQPVRAQGLFEVENRFRLTERRRTGWA